VYRALCEGIPEDGFYVNRIMLEHFYLV